MNEVSEALLAVGISPNEADSNLEAANIVDGLYAIARAVNRHAEATEMLAKAVHVAVEAHLTS